MRVRMRETVFMYEECMKKVIIILDSEDVQWKQGVSLSGIAPSLSPTKMTIQWSVVRVTPSGNPLKSEFLKNRGKYHKMVLGHHRGIS